MDQQNQKNKNNRERKEGPLAPEKAGTNEETTPKPEEKTAILVSELEELRKKAFLCDEYNERFLRLGADFDNTRKRLEREKQEFLKFANEAIILELLNILDDLERVVELAQGKHENLSSFLKGVEMILAHLYELLKKYGVKPIDAEGKLFDPHFHEAIMQVENKELPEHTIVEELQRGYLLNERVIRTAKVGVTKKPAAEGEPRQGRETSNQSLD